MKMGSATWTISILLLVYLSSGFGGGLFRGGRRAELLSLAAIQGGGVMELKRGVQW